MESSDFLRVYDFSGQTIAVTGGGGVLCSELCRALAGCHANVVVLDREVALAEKTLASLAGSKGRHRALFVDVLDLAAIDKAVQTILTDYGRIDGLVNGAGGNHPKATTNPEQSFFDLPVEALQFVSNLNLQGTILPSQVVARAMARQKQGVILNISSMNAFRPLTRIPAYSAAKAAVSNFTQWLAVHLAQEYSPDLRVNAIAPGFFLTEQNRFLLTDKETGALTARGDKIIAHTPMARFGTPEDLVGASLWLLSPASKFVTGIVVPIDGGFSAYSGV
ncbi:MAG: SDR family oxidoreductase [Deltaproteobacteria bacterium]|nr:SDR family oxidoreductase [Deltaproteobacteria bacterium]